MFVTSIIVFVLVSVHPTSCSDTWNYDRDDLVLGPTAWATNFPTCAGTSNSPIDFDSTTVIESEKTEDWMFLCESSTFDVEDEGFAVKWSLSGMDEFITRGGALGNDYKLVQFHIHWGLDDSKGGEHTVDSEAFPMEIHFVHVRSDYPDIGAAAASGNADALAVLGFFFAIQGRDNFILAPLMRSIKQVRNSQTSEIHDFKIENLELALTELTRGAYYRYFGGLTTPACNEIVQWTVFADPIPISVRQMDLIRNFKVAPVEKGDFFRDPVPVNDRTIMKFV